MLMKLHQIVFQELWFKYLVADPKHFFVANKEFFRFFMLG